MRVVKIRENGLSGTKGLAEHNQLPDQDESQRARELVLSSVEIHRPQPQPQPQPQAQIVRWERFLPVRSLKVLLVENDDCTRHVVSALLRKCSYEVTPVQNGLEAWKILEDLNNQIDLVLTEVVMPGLSGIGLLSKIMSHRNRQYIPTIMMSSYDSMGMVLKCLSKGAADFLVKPIRKNELKILWQHVWRKWHSSSGSGSESGIRTENFVGAKHAEGSDQNAASNDENDRRSVGLQVLEGSDDGSGTQSGQAFGKKVEISNGKLSAFTRYNNGSSATSQGQTGNVGSCSPVDDSPVVEKQSDINVLDWGIPELNRAKPQAQRCYKRAELRLHSKLAKCSRVELGLGIGCHYSAQSSDTVARLSSVRYQSRKKIAERRARAHGQCVRQVQKTKGKNADS